MEKTIMQEKINILYIGSSNSANLINTIDLSKYIVICANNAWKLFKTSKFDVWIHSGDFPYENRPKIKNFNTEISHNDYMITAQNIINKLNISCKSPPHHLGYTIFFLGLYWICDSFPNSKISLLGFDHDYNKNKVKKWNDNNRPNPQNHYLKPKGQTIQDWAAKFFEGMEHDSFYGHGTPDPLRLGEQHIKDKFDLLKKYVSQLNIELVNLSPIISDINTISKETIL